MISEKLKQECCGCGACKQACPKNAITMIEDEKGFLYPSVNTNLCVRCGLCDKVCGFTVNYAKFDKKPRIFAVKHKDDAVREASTSGGVFTALTDAVLAQGGVIYGAQYDDVFRVFHSRATDYAKRNCFRGSKYVQSDTENTYQQAKNDLQQGKKVLYSGTPCQIAGLCTFLGKTYDNLITVDVLCHGVPSPKLWREFLCIIEKKAKARISSVNFRDKSQGWSNSGRLVFSYKERNANIWGENSYNTLFLKNIILRDSCYACQFRSYTRPSDITIADFWGIKINAPKFHDEKGVSLVMINTIKGQRLFDEISEQIISEERSCADCRKDQITGKVKKGEQLEAFWDCYFKKGLKKALLGYTEFSMTKTYFNKILRRIVRMLKRA